MDPEARLREMGLELPPAPAPVGAYVPAVRTGRLVLVSGQLPTKDGRLLATGKVGGEVSVEQARACARQAVLNALAAAAAEAGGLGAIARILRLTGYVASAPGFTNQAEVLNAASDLLVALFGEAGRHSRVAVGATELPLRSPVELELIVEVQE